MHQVQDAGHVGMVAHLATEDDGLTLAGKVLRRKVVQIHAIGQDLDQPDLIGPTIARLKLLQRGAVLA